MLGVQESKSYNVPIKIFAIGTPLVYNTKIELLNNSPYNWLLVFLQYFSGSSKES